MNGFHGQSWIVLDDSLRKAGSFANDADAGSADHDSSRWLLPAAQNCPGFAYASQQFFKRLSFHLPISSDFTRPSANDASLPATHLFRGGS